MRLPPDPARSPHNATAKKVSLKECLSCGGVGCTLCQHAGADPLEELKRACASLRSKPEEEPEDAGGQEGCCSPLRYRLLLLSVRHPLLLILVLQLLGAVLCAVLWQDGAIDIDFGSLARARSNSSLAWDAYQNAWTVSAYAPVQKKDHQLSNGSVVWRHNVIHIIYHLEAGATLLDELKLYAIQQYEQRLRSLPGWRRLCYDQATGSAIGCDPGESLSNYVWPERLSKGERNASRLVGAGGQPLRLSGGGSVYLPAKAAVAMLRGDEDQFDRLRRLLPMDFETASRAALPPVRLLQSHFAFASSVGPPGLAQYASTSAAEEDFAKFLDEDLHPVLRDTDPGLEAHDIRVFYDSSLLDRVDVFYALVKDCELAIGGAVLALLILRLRLGSSPLALVALVVSAEAIPLGLVLTKHFSGILDLSIINCVSIFIVLAIGTHIAFVLTDGWHQSWWSVSKAEEAKHLAYEDPADEGHAALVGLTQSRPCLSCFLGSESEKVRQKRLLWLWRNSGVSCTASTVCVASSFLAHLVSALLPLRELGLFVGICTLLALFMQLATYSFALVALDAFSERRTPDSGKAASVVPAPLSLPPGTGLDATSGPSGGFASWSGGSLPKLLRLRGNLLMALFAGLGICCIIAVPLTLQVSAAVPVSYPADHNQVVGKKLLNDFVETAHAKVALSPALADAWLCDVTTAREEDQLSVCRDFDDACTDWVAEPGACDVASPSSAAQRCPRSCGLCSFCLARWCDMQAPVDTEGASGSARCDCYEAGAVLADQAVAASATVATALPLRRKPQPPGRVDVEALFVGAGQHAWLDMYANFTVFAREVFPSADNRTKQAFRYGSEGPYAGDPDFRGAFPQRPLVQQHWRSGSLAAYDSFEAPVLSVKTGDGNATDTVRFYCYCGGVRPCEATGKAFGSFFWPQEGPRTTPTGVEGGNASRQALAGGARRLRSAGAPAPPAAWPEAREASAVPGRRLGSSLAVVAVVWGLVVQELGPGDCFVQTDRVEMWEFDALFNPSDPWAQRAMLDLVEGIPEVLGVRVPSARSSWMDAYEQWLVAGEGEDFPSRNFDETIRRFLNSHVDFAAFFLCDARSGRVRAVRVDFDLLLPADAPVGAALAAMSAWDGYISERNSKATLRANGAWHTSELWARAEAQRAVEVSTTVVVAIAAAVGILALAATTRDVYLTLLSVLSVLLIALLVLFFMATLLGWTFGGVEVAAFAVFVGLMFSFNLHIAYAYSHAPDGQGQTACWQKVPTGGAQDSAAAERRQRAAFAAEAAGRSLVGSAATSAGFAAFMLFSTTQFFVKFGVVMLLATVFSFVYSLVFLPALLMLCGPTQLQRWPCRPCATAAGTEQGPGGEAAPAKAAVPGARLGEEQPTRTAMPTPAPAPVGVTATRTAMPVPAAPPALPAPDEPPLPTSLPPLLAYCQGGAAPGPPDKAYFDAGCGQVCSSNSTEEEEV